MHGWRPGPEDESVAGLVRSRAEECAESAFLDINGAEHSYADVWNRSCALARGLRSLGVGRGDTVLTMLDNNIEGVEAWFAANILGAIWIPVNTALKGEFLRHVVADSKARVVITESDFLERFDRIADEIPDVATVLRRSDSGGSDSRRFVTRPLDEFLLDGTDDPYVETNSDDVSLLIYTGGTTGPSKGCIISHGYVHNCARSFIEQSGRTREDHNWSPLPMFHFNLVSGTIFASLILRSSASIAPRFSVSQFWPDIERTQPTVINLLGSMGALIAQMDDTPEMKSCHGLIRVVHGAPFPPELQQVWRQRFGAVQVGANAYGLGECFPITTLQSGEEAPDGSSGKRNSAHLDVRLFDDQGSEVADGGVGEVVVRPMTTNVMFQGYWRRPDWTLKVNKDLWFHTGDLGRFDEDGFFYFVDRKKDYLRRRGENISSQEMEATFLTHPALELAAVHAVPSDLTEDDVKLTAVLVPGAQLSEEELFHWAVDRIPYFALPRYIEFRSELPVSPVGRVLKYKLRDEGATAATWDREVAGVEFDRR